ncbi:MAG: hypothetical protein CL678_08080 [Bdellovibrionaceae bacterium]|nr:hypothetical protein [Pseudobdellovibrionaceae bacterium]
MSGESIREIKKLFRLALPIVAVNLGLSTYGLVDIWVAGKASPEILAGVGAGSNFLFLVAIFAIGLNNALDTFVSQADGAGDIQKVRDLATQGVWTAFFVSFLLLPLFYFLVHYYKDWVKPSPEVEPHVIAYIKIVMWEIPALCIGNALLRYWQARSIVAPTVVAIWVSNLFNLIGNFILVLGWGGWFPPMGATGAAISTVIAVHVTLVILTVYTLYTFHKNSNLPIRMKKPNWNLIRNLLKIGIPSGLHFQLEVAAFALSTTLITRLGALPTAIHQISLSCASLMFMIPMGLSTAAAVRVGNHLGRNNPLQSERSGWVALGMGATTATIGALIFLIFGESIFKIFSNDPAVIQGGLGIIWIVAGFQIFDSTQAIAAGALRGAGNTTAALFYNLIGHYPIGMALSIYLCFYTPMKVQGYWLGLAAGLFFVSINLVWKWKTLWKSHNLIKIT